LASPVELHARLMIEAEKGFEPVFRLEPACPFVQDAYDQDLILGWFPHYVKNNALNRKGAPSIS